MDLFSWKAPSSNFIFWWLTLLLSSSSSSRRRWKSTTSMTNNSWKGISVDSLDDDDADVDEVEGEAGESYRREHFRFRS